MYFSRDHRFGLLLPGLSIPCMKIGIEQSVVYLVNRRSNQRKHSFKGYSTHNFLCFSHDKEGLCSEHSILICLTQGLSSLDNAAIWTHHYILAFGCQFIVLQDHIFGWTCPSFGLVTKQKVIVSALGKFMENFDRSFDLLQDQVINIMIRTR